MLNGIALIALRWQNIVPRQFTDRYPLLTRALLVVGFVHAVLQRGAFSRLSPPV